MMISNKERFKELVKQYIKRDGVEQLMTFLEKSDFYTAPASTRFHDSDEGGLCRHSIEVFNELTKADHLDISMETLALVSLFHDICKVNFYKVEMRNAKNEQGKWVQVPYYTVDDQLPLGHSEKSVIMLMDVIKLTTEEIMAIRFHMGGFEPKENYQYLSKAYERYPLALELHIADMRATYKR